VRWDDTGDGGQGSEGQDLMRWSENLE
jgi:hypothetical protein